MSPNAIAIKEDGERQLASFIPTTGVAVRAK